MVKNLTFQTILCRLAAEYFMQKGVELGFDLRLTSTWTEVTRGCWMASFSAWHVNCDPRSPRLSDIRTSLRPVPVPSSSSNELTLPVKREYPAHAKKCLSLRGDINCAVSLPEITLEPLNQVTRGMGLPPEDWQIRRSSWPSLKGPMIALPEMSLPSAVDTVKFLGSAVNTIQMLYYRYVICLKRSEGGRRPTERSVFKFSFRKLAVL